MPSRPALRARVARSTSLLFLIGALLVGGGAADADDHADGPQLPAALPTTARVSVASDATQANDPASRPSISGDGRYVAFHSGATNLVAGDTNGKDDVFVHDRYGGTTTRVSVAAGGGQANGHSWNPAISANGRFVAFQSGATNLVAGGTNGGNVFVYDRLTATTSLVSVATGGGQSNGFSSEPAISGDGRHVTFLSAATNLVAGDTNGIPDVFVHDRQTGTTTRASISTGGVQADSALLTPTISTDGSHVAFNTKSPLVAGDTNGVHDVFVRDLQAGTTTRASVATGGIQGDDESVWPALSADGRYVSFHSWATNLVGGDTNGVIDVFVRDRQTGITTRVSVDSAGTQGNGDSFPSRISADGRLVAFSSFASNLVAGDTNGVFDIFVHDRVAATTTRVSVGSAGTQANGESTRLAISADGRFVAFESVATNLVAGDTNGDMDVFVHDRGGPDIVGQLRVTTTPALPAQIIVDGIPRDSWGLNWVDIDPGPHAVCFGPVPGHTPPPCEEVTVEVDQTATVDGVYTPRGTLRVLTSPPVPSTITVDGHPANDWGVWTDLDPGTYEVCYGPVVDLAAPPCEDAVITAGNTTTLTGTFTSSPGAPGPTGHGYLRATTDPAVASRITIDGHPADTWGLTWVKLTPGTYQVCFEGVIHTTAPSCQTAFINAGATTVVEADFIVHGFLRVITDPAVGATITVDGEPANAWGVWTSLEPATYEVCFRPLLRLLPPPCEDAVISAGATTSLTATYS